jgi:competence protein ComEA
MVVPPTSFSSTTSLPGGQVIVHVTGKVRKPGVITLPIGSRVADAVNAAGGVRAGATAGGLNLARKLSDGEQIVVGASSGPGLGTVPAPDPASGTSDVLDLNAATPIQLETLPGVGEVLAGRIAEFRQTHAGFRSVDQLRQVTGIGEKKFAELRDKVRV